MIVSRNRFLFSNIKYYSTDYYWFSFDYDAPYNTSRDDDDDDDDEDDNNNNEDEHDDDEVMIKKCYQLKF